MSKFEKINLQKFETEKIENLSKIVGGNGYTDTTDTTSVIDDTGIDPTDGKSRTKSNNTNE